MKTNLIILILLFYFNTMALADEQEVKSLENSDSKPPVVATVKTIPLKKDYFFIAGFSPIGWGPANKLALGPVLGMYLSRTTQLLLEHTVSFPDNLFGRKRSQSGANGESTNTSTHGWESDSSASALGLHLKQEILWGQYIKVGVAYRNIRSKQSFSNSGSNEQKWEFEASSYAAVISVGSHWAIGPVIFGCDWLGYVQPFSSGFSLDSSSGQLTEYGRSKIESEKDQLVRNPSWQYARLFGAFRF